MRYALLAPLTTLALSACNYGPTLYHYEAHVTVALADQTIDGVVLGSDGVDIGPGQMWVSLRPTLYDEPATDVVYPIFTSGGAPTLASPFDIDAVVESSGALRMQLTERYRGGDIGVKEAYDLTELQPEEFFSSFELRVSADEALQPLLSGQLGADGTVMERLSIDITFDACVEAIAAEAAPQQHTGDYVAGQIPPLVAKTATTCFFEAPNDGDRCLRHDLPANDDASYDIGPLAVTIRVTPICWVSAG